MLPAQFAVTAEEDFTDTYRAAVLPIIPLSFHPYFSEIFVSYSVSAAPITDPLLCQLNQLLAAVAPDRLFTVVSYQRTRSHGSTFSQSKPSSERSGRCPLNTAL